MRYEPLDHKEVIRQLKDYVWTKHNFRIQNITASDVAEYLGISRSALLEIVKKNMNMTFLEYVNDCRVRHSHKMVMDNHGKFSMEHIQVMSGFGSLRSFYTKYKEKYGELPKETEARQINI